MVSVPSVAISALMPMRVTIRPLTRPHSAPTRMPTGRPTSAGQPHQPATTPAQTPAKRQRRSDREVERAADHQEHHAADQDADRREVEQHGAHVGGGREIVRVDDAHHDGERHDQHEQRQLARIGKPAHDAARAAPRAVLRRARPRFAGPVSLMPRQRRFACAASATEAVYRVASRSTCSSVAPSPGSSPTVRPSAITTMRSASASTSGRSEDTTSERHAAVGQRAQQAVDLGARADVDAARRLVDDQQPRLHRQPFGEQHLLLVAARQIADDLVHARRRDAQLVDEVSSPAPRPWRCEKWRRTRPCASTVAAMLLTMSMPRNRPDVLAVLGHHADAGRLAVPRALRIDRLAADRGSCRRGRRARPKIASQNSLRPEPISPARQTISPARTVIEADCTSGGALTSSASSTTSPILRRCAVARKMHLAPDHQPDQLVGRGLGDRARAGELAVLQHRHRVAERENLGQAVRDIDDRDAVCRRAAARRRTASRSRSASAPRSARRGSASCRSRDSALAISTICACAGDSAATFSAGSMATPSSAISAWRLLAHRRARRPGRAICVGWRPAKMFSATESCGTSEPSWWTMPMPRSPAAFSSSRPISAPSTRIVPWSRG